MYPEDEIVRDHLDRIRKAEVEQVKAYFRRGMRVLEIGGGNGYQASIMASWRCEVFSIDLANRPFAEKCYYPVQDYDGQEIPFPNTYFDIVFSSSTLEHIQSLPTIFVEMHRVLKPGGLAIHIVPSSAWRFWTSVAHYIYLLKYLVRERPSAIPGVEKGLSVRQKFTTRGVAYVIKRALLAGPHGEYPSALRELYYFSQNRWAQVFLTNGFDIVRVIDNGLFYTGYALFPSLSLCTRQKLARFLGSACHTFVTHSNLLRG